MEINVTINGVEKTFTCKPDETVMRVLRREGYHSVRFGSDSGETGAAAILLDGRLVSSDIFLAAQADGHTLDTIEGLAQGLHLHPIQEAFLENQVPQCSWCMSGQMMTAIAFLEENPHPNETEIVAAMGENYCRCGC